MNQAHLRRGRGYSFEAGLVKKFKEYGWNARRLGGSSTELPDIVSTNNITSSIFSIECKSTVSNYVRIPLDQIIRCNNILDMFSVYDFKSILFAVKFAKSGKNKLQYYFFKFIIYGNIENIRTVTCNRKGVLKVEPSDNDEFSYLVKRYDSFDDLISFKCTEKHDNIRKRKKFIIVPNQESDMK